MKKLLSIFCLLFASYAGAQCTATTPNLGFIVPGFNCPNWNTSINSNFFQLDSVIPNIQAGITPFGTFASKPVSCIPGTLYVATDLAPTGANVLVCGPGSTWFQENVLTFGNAINPSSFGPTTGLSGVCSVDKTTNISALTCANKITAAGGGKGGFIFDPGGGADYTANVFGDTGHSTQPSISWIGTTGSGGNTPSTANPTMPIFDVPQIFSSGSEFISWAGQLSWTGDTSTGWGFLTGTNFESPLTNRGTNWFNYCPVLTNASTTGGHIPPGTYYVKLGEANNLYGNNAGSAHGLAGPTTGSCESSITVPSGTSTNQVGITGGFPQLGSTDSNGFQAREFFVGASAVSGQEVVGCTGTATGWCNNVAVVCAGGVGTLDPQGDCLSTVSGGNFTQGATLTSIPSYMNSLTNAYGLAQSGAFKFPIADLSSVAAVVGNDNSNLGQAGSNTFSERLMYFSALCGPVFGNPNTVGNANTGSPSVAVWIRNAQESTVVDDLLFAGGCSGASLYITTGQGSYQHLFSDSNHLYQGTNATGGTGGPPGPSGTLNTVGGAVTLVTGANFQANWVGGPLWITVGGTPTAFQISAWSGPSSVTILNPPANQTGANWFFGCAYNSGVTIVVGTACFTNVVVDSTYYHSASSINIRDSTFNEGSPNAAHVNVHVRGGSTANASVGNNTNLIALHMENASSAWIAESPSNFQGDGSNVLCDDGANCEMFAGMGWSTGTGAFLRRTATGGTINCVGCVAQSGNKIVIQDDPRSITIRPAVTVGTTATVDTNIPVTYDSMNYVAKNPLLSNQAISSTAFVTIGASGAGNGPMTFGVEPLDFYKLSCKVIATSSAATAGPQIQVTGPASPTFVQNNLSFVPQATLSTPVLYSNGFSTAVSAGAAVVSAGTALYIFEEYIQAGAAGGTISVQDAPQGTGTLTNLPGTVCDLTPQTQVP